MHSAERHWQSGLARWVSIALHPFVTGLLLIGGVEAHRGTAAVVRSVAVVGGLLVLPLAILTARQVRSGAWTTVDASRPRERPILFVVGGAGIAAVLAFYAQGSADAPLARGAAQVLVMLALCALLTPWVKLSMHMVAATLAATVLLVRGVPLGLPLAAALPVLAWSRVALGRHRWMEVALGLAVGAGTGVLIAQPG